MHQNGQQHDPAQRDCPIEDRELPSWRDGWGTHQKTSVIAANRETGRETLSSSFASAQFRFQSGVKVCLTVLAYLSAVAAWLFP
jgi:hypothetical protein